MKPLFLLSAILLLGCASNSHKCVLLHFNNEPSQYCIKQLAKTQNESLAIVADWFKSGERGFILSAIHTNEIQIAIDNGATVKQIK
jgi:hypothetical protein